MANRICWLGHVLRRGDDHVMRRALDFEVEGQKKKDRQKGHERISVKVHLRREDEAC